MRDAGAFDGILGVVLAIAIVESFAGQPLPFDIEVIGFSEEEGVRFPPFIGSRALAGTLDPQTLSRTDAAGITIEQAIRDFGLDPAGIPKLRLNSAIGFFEIHIEQGPVLDSANESVAIVDAIVGQTRAAVKVHRLRQPRRYDTHGSPSRRSHRRRPLDHPCRRNRPRHSQSRRHCRQNRRPAQHYKRHSW